MASAHEKRLAFARGIFEGKSQRDAALAAGYKPGPHLDGTASKLCDHADVKEKLAELRAAADEAALVSRARVLAILSQQIEGLQGYMQYAERPIGPEPPEGQADERPRARVLIGVDIEKLEREGKLHLIEGVKFSNDGRPEIRLATTQGAIDRLAKLLGWNKPEKHQHEHRHAEIGTKDPAEMTKEEIDAERAELQKKLKALK